MFTTKIPAKPTSLTSTLTLATVKSCQKLAFSDNLDAEKTSDQESEKALNPQGKQGFFDERVNGFEPSTYSLGSNQGCVQNPTKTKAKRGSAKSLTSTLTLESQNPANLATVDESLMRRLLIAFGTADESQRLAILTVAETIVASKRG